MQQFDADIITLEALALSKFKYNSISACLWCKANPCLEHYRDNKECAEDADNIVMASPLADN